jgi:pimeloyl-ACP methyl ester carboxylesterase/DNA-binding CsgD family transcriptional regulator
LQGCGIEGPQTWEPSRGSGAGGLARTDRETGNDVGLIVGAFYALAADPGEWDRLIESLQAVPAADASEHPRLAAMVAGGERVAQLSIPTLALGGEAPLAAVMAVSRTGRRLAVNGAVVGSALATLAAGASDPATEEVLREARARLKAAPGRSAVMSFPGEGDAAPAFGLAMDLADLPAALRAGLAPQPQAEPGALALLAPAQGRDEGFWDGFREAFGLSPAETRLVTHLRGGASLKEAAKALNVSVNTVRNQLAAVFQKTGMNRQSDLVRALAEVAALTGPAPLVSAPAALLAAAAPEIEWVRLTDGRRIAFRDYGAADGKPVLMFHAGLGASLMLAGTDQACRELGLRLVVAERPGVGRSDPRDPYSLDGVAQDMTAFVRALDLGPVQFCSFTSGARFALACASHMGRDVSRVLMLSPRPPQDAQTPAPETASPMVAIQRRILAHPWLAEPLAAVMRLRQSHALIGRIMLASARGPGDAQYVRDHPELIDLMTEGLAEALRSPRGVAEELLHSNQPAQAPAPTAPIVVWHGEEDAYATADEVGAWLGPRLSELRRVPDIGNYLIHKHWLEALAWLAGANR